MDTKHMIEIMGLPEDERRDLFIHGGVNREWGMLILMRGDRSIVTIPLEFFEPSGTATPDFDDFSIGDYGNTLRFGDYEATCPLGHPRPGPSPVACRSLGQRGNPRRTSRARVCPF